MRICGNGHNPIVHNDKQNCPLCSLMKHNNQVHDFIESKGQKFINELLDYQKINKPTKDIKEQLK